MTQSREKRVADAVRASKEIPDSIVVLSTGVVLEVHRTPNMIFMEITRKFKAPVPPRIMNEDIGSEEENTNDPNYIAAFQLYQAELSLAIIDTMILMGTQIKTVPAGFQMPSDTRWSSRLKALNIDPGEDEFTRYLMWIKYEAAPEDEDINKIVMAVGRTTGVSEEDVEDAIANFRDISR